MTVIHFTSICSEFFVFHMLLQMRGPWVGEELWEPDRWEVNWVCIGQNNNWHMYLFYLNPQSNE
jgi:hypothetical protein